MEWPGESIFQKLCDLKHAKNHQYLFGSNLRTPRPLLNLIEETYQIPKQLIHHNEGTDQ